MNKKKIREYEEKYGDIPNNLIDRLVILKNRLNTKQELLLDEEITRISNIKWNHISYVFYVIPEGCPRPRVGKSGIFYVKGSKDIHEYIHTLIDPLYLVGGIKVRSSMYLPTPIASMTKVEACLAELGLIPHISIPDWDNIAKTYMDSIQNFLIKNDSSIFDARIIKRYSIKPRIELNLWYRNEIESKYNSRKIKKYDIINPNQTLM